MTPHETAIELLKKHTLPFVVGNESDYLIARNNALNEVTYKLDKSDIFEVVEWHHIYYELKKNKLRKI